MKLKKPILIFECANAHGGNIELLSKTISKFSIIKYSNKHIKFQPFYPDTISLEDYSWHKIYHKLKFGANEWKEIIKQSATNFDGVWIDIFDVFGVNVLSSNLSYITGIKLQASVLDNQEVFSALIELNLSNHLLMLNVSGIEVSNIDIFIDRFNHLDVKQLILQVGHQAYPTEIKDTGLQKIEIIKTAYPEMSICVADHVDAENEMAMIIPIIGLSLGADIVEKHICINREEAEYDFYSALEYDEMKLLSKRIKDYVRITSGKFISQSEKEYLNNSIQIPVTNTNLPAGSMVSDSDIIYRRTGQDGMNYLEIKKKQNQGYILKKNIKKKSTVTSDSFKLANVGVIVACRMKSSRLAEKAIIKLEGITSVERCLMNCLEMPMANTVVLATSTLEEDALLKEYTLGGKVKFWRGDPDDVIKRYLGACEKYNINVVIRVTADCPLISPEIAEVLLNRHFTTGADYTVAKECAVGTGCEIYNVEALQRVINHLGSANHSEYMTWYMKNNTNIFKVEIVDLPNELIRDYRLTLDYQEDLELFQKLFHDLSNDDNAPTLKNVFNILDNNHEMVSLNSHLTLKYKTDQKLIDHLNQVTKISVR